MFNRMRTAGRFGSARVPRWTKAFVNYCISLIAGGRGLAFWGVLFTLVLAAASVNAAEEYPCKPEREQLGAFQSKLTIDRNYPVKFQMGPLKFSIPYAYGTGRQTPERVNCAPLRDGFSFAFWFPDLRAPWTDIGTFTTGFRPDEGKGKPGVDEFVVEIVSVQLMGEGFENATVYPSKGLSNLLSQATTRYLLMPAYEGLLNLKYLDGREGLDQFFNLEDGRDELYIDCFPSSSEAPVCRFDLYLSDLSLGIHGRFPKDSLSKWRAIKDSTRMLLQRWISP